MPETSSSTIPCSNKAQPSDSASDSASAPSSLPTPSPLPNGEEILQLVYCSSSYSRNISSEDIQTILRQARRNNTSLGITGLLLYRDGQFVQFLEGPRVVVTPLYDRISCDPRHNTIITLINQVVQKRDFESWSMGFREVAQPRSQPAGSSTAIEADAFNDLLNHATFDTVELPVEMSSRIKTLIRLYHGLLLRL
ncbi:BLUF domain [Phaffia rhodozyma]|uniref:BLUF domain n=1 Tax=Phaffia rhodozyma TaxID=264483 RepID=A0A0F7SFN1_PHARH|nr:BLUF domain [Phaffia rhodozyma]